MKRVTMILYYPKPSIYGTWFQVVKRRGQWVDSLGIVWTYDPADDCYRDRHFNKALTKHPLD